ncbi:hypothetical protein HPG69_015494 [Diceros bicornis minor]|uniref:Uncharacterized protein n=1 Tax=Diceros bicornis minor TaxID=77932 RepID=A0A7J7F2N5_DICBM|nr:hypothetical protein HPG69_015494 [Diceros bicornis minor]
MASFNLSPILGLQRADHLSRICIQGLPKMMNADMDTADAENQVGPEGEKNDMLELNTHLKVSLIDAVKEENLKLKSENQVLGQYIENISASRILQTSDIKSKRKCGHPRSKTTSFQLPLGGNELHEGPGPLLEPSLNILAHLASKIYSNARPGPGAGDSTDICEMQKCLGTGSGPILRTEKALPLFRDRRLGKRARKGRVGAETSRAERGSRRTSPGLRARTVRTPRHGPRSPPYHLLAKQGQRGVQVGRLGGQRRGPGPAAARAPAAQLVLDARLLRVQPLQVPPAPRRAAARRRVQQPAQTFGERGQPVHPQPPNRARRPSPAHRAQPGHAPGPPPPRPKAPPARPLPGGAPPTSPPRRAALAPGPAPSRRPDLAPSPPLRPTAPAHLQPRPLAPDSSAPGPAPASRLTSSLSQGFSVTCPRSSPDGALPRLSHSQ